ncbi:hypothetical protein EP1X_05660 [Thermococcus sp. EP1]|nr:hypothetical protein EP1X_05660 [Thermococcus sp. EP1]
MQLIFLFIVGIFLITIAHKVPNPLSPLMSSMGGSILAIILFGVGLVIVLKVLEEYDRCRRYHLSFWAFPKLILYYKI